MALLKYLAAALILVAAVCLSSARSLQQAPVSNRVRDGPKKPCEITKRGRWADGVTFTVTPNPLDYDKKFRVDLNLYVYEDLYFGTIEGNITRLDQPWQHRYYGVLCDKIKCPWYKGQNFSFVDEFPSPSTYIDKGRYSMNGAIYNEDDELLVGITIYECLLS